jgi:hypothetical protein
MRMLYTGFVPVAAEGRLWLPRDSGRVLRCKRRPFSLPPGNIPRGIDHDDHGSGNKRAVGAQVTGTR